MFLDFSDWKEDKTNYSKCSKFLQSLRLISSVMPWSVQHEQTLSIAHTHPCAHACVCACKYDMWRKVKFEFGAFLQSGNQAHLINSQIFWGYKYQQIKRANHIAVSKLVLCTG